MVDAATRYARGELAPGAVDWDQRKYFPVDIIRNAGALGMGGVYVAEDVGGSGLGRVDATLIFEALAGGCPSIAAYLSIHNMVAWMIDRFGDVDQRQRWLPGLCSLD